MLAIGIVFLVCAQGLHTALAAAAKHPAEEVPIRYPEPIAVNDDVPEACKHKTYCTVKPKDYPQEKFNDMLKGYKPLPQPSMIVELKNRQGDPDDEDNCESDVTYEPLYRVREKRYDPWRTVVQAPDQDFVQRVRIESCKNPDAPCFKVFTPVPEYVTFCKQKVNTWEVLVAKGNNETEFIKAELPVCCSCHYRPVDFVTRFGKPKK